MKWREQVQLLLAMVACIRAFPIRWQANQIMCVLRTGWQGRCFASSCFLACQRVTCWPVATNDSELSISQCLSHFPASYHQRVAPTIVPLIPLSFKCVHQDPVRPCQVATPGWCKWQARGGNCLVRRNTICQCLTARIRRPLGDSRSVCLTKRAVKGSLSSGSR